MTIAAAKIKREYKYGIVFIWRKVVSHPKFCGTQYNGNTPTTASKKEENTNCKNCLDSFWSRIFTVFSNVTTTKTAIPRVKVAMVFALLSTKP